MANTTMDNLKKKVAQREIDSKTAGHPDELTHITFELYPVEILTAAAKELGDKALPKYVTDIYEFGQLAQSNNSQVKKSQLTGLALTHAKVSRWLESKNAKSYLDLDNKAVLKAFLRFHQQRIEESLEALQILTEEITK